LIRRAEFPVAGFLKEDFLAKAALPALVFLWLGNLSSFVIAQNMV
jgi:hypothetical protein